MENNETLILDTKTHIYTIGKKQIPSVSQIVQAIVGIEVFGSDWHLQRGTALHRAIALYLKGTLNEKSVDTHIKDALESGKKAVKELGLKPTLIEPSLYHPILNFAGTPDLLSDTTLIDWKSSHSNTTEIQLGGYVFLLEKNKMKVKKCMEIVIDENGYKLTEYGIERCKNLFLSALNLYNWKRR